MELRSGEYSQKGDYHIELDPNWPYLPVYLRKMAWIRNHINRINKSRKILDAGCGEGILVKEYNKKGWEIVGIDLNYASEYVIQGSILDTKFEDRSFDNLFCLDVMEHIKFDNQEDAFDEFSRILRPGGELVLSVPNLAHLASRLSFLFTGKLLRTSTIDRHPGDRPIHEYVSLLRQNFEIRKRVGIFPTFPILSFLTIIFPSKVVWLHNIYNRLLNVPNICFLNILVCEKK